MPQFDFVFLNLLFFRYYFFEAEDTATSLHTVISFAISVLLNFLLLKYQGKNESPFDTNPKTVSFGVSCLLLYCFTNECAQRISSGRGLGRFACAIHRCVLLFGCLSVASLASLLYSDSATPAIFVLCSMIAVGDLLPGIYQRIRAKFRETHFQVQLFLPNLLRQMLRRMMVNHRQLILPR